MCICVWLMANISKTNSRLFIKRNNFKSWLVFDCSKKRLYNVYIKQKNINYN